MATTHQAAALLITAAIALYCTSGPLSLASEQGAADDSVGFYNQFLDRWFKTNPGHLNVASETRPILGFIDKDESAAKCLLGFRDYVLPMSQVTSLTATPLAKRPDVHLVDPGRWQASDQPRPFSEGLMTFTGVAYNEKRDRATLHFWFYCGPICGGGGFVKFRKLESGWKIEEDVCGQWAS